MEGPHIKNLIEDKERGVTYEVWAYRKLSYEELLSCVASYKKQVKRKPKRGQRPQIMTIFGHERPDPR